MVYPEAVKRIIALQPADFLLFFAVEYHRIFELLGGDYCRRFTVNFDSWLSRSFDRSSYHKPVYFGKFHVVALAAKFS